MLRLDKHRRRPAMRTTPGRHHTAGNCEPCITPFSQPERTAMMADNNRKRSDHRSFVRHRKADEEVSQAVPGIGYSFLGWSPGALRDYASSEHWHTDPATEAQLRALRKRRYDPPSALTRGPIECPKRRGYDPPYRLTKGVASYVLNKPTPCQRKILERRGRWSRWPTFAEASELLQEIAMLEGWNQRKG
jgi:hypothetical protein